MPTLTTGLFLVRVSGIGELVVEESSLASGVEGQPESGEAGADREELHSLSVTDSVIDGASEDVGEAVTAAAAAAATRARSRFRCCLLAASRRSFSALSK